MHPRAACAWLLLCVSTFAGLASAHPPGWSQSRWQLQDGRLTGQLEFSPDELLLLLPPAADRDGDGRLAAAEFAAAAPALARRLAATVALQRDGQTCALQAGPPQWRAADAADWTLRSACPGTGPWTLSLDGLLAQLRIGHRHLQTWTDGAGAEASALLSAATPTQVFEPGAGAAQGARPAVLWVGAEHILFGFDHLAFVLGLVLAGGRWRGLVGVLTAFTVAHSLTLALMAAGVVVAPPDLVEPLIALSVALVALANLRRLRTTAAAAVGPASLSWSRWVLVFLIGLVHGFGFAGAIAGLSPDSGPLWPWLLAFNLGIELAQVGVATLVLLLLRALANRPRAWRRALLAGNTLLLLVGTGWTLQRLLG
jgi:hypothetical protein